MMNRLASLFRDAPKTFEIEQEALTNNRKKFTPRAKFMPCTTLLDTASLFDNIFLLKLDEDINSRKFMKDLCSLDEFTALQFINQH
jgi:hypothetical protein